MRERYRQGHPWCKGQLEVFFKLVTDNRSMFAPELQARIDEFYSTLKSKQSAISKGDTFTRNQGWKSWAV